MPTQCRVATVLASVLVVSTVIVGQAAETDQPGRLSAPGQRLRLWYDQPAEKWTSALPIGNGRMGAMVFGGVPDERIQFNEDTLW